MPFVRGYVYFEKGLKDSTAILMRFCEELQKAMAESYEGTVQVVVKQNLVRDGGSVLSEFMSDLFIVDDGRHLLALIECVKNTKNLPQGTPFNIFPVHSNKMLGRITVGGEWDSQIRLIHTTI